MYKALFSRLRQKNRTVPYPKKEPVLPDRFRGLPKIDRTKCPSGCRVCQEACPTDAIVQGANGPDIDLGKCLFCQDCQNACPQQALSFSNDYRLSATRRDDLWLRGDKDALTRASANATPIYRRSFKIRQVSAAGCNACEADINVLTTVVWDIGRFGIQVVASPRHADALLVTGPVSQNMALALQKTYEALPPPRIVMVSGACAISGGPFVDHPEANNGVEKILPVDLYIPGCPPHPATILDGLLRFLGRIN
jgi:Ni,Fe-hydrogenase III small subunit/ferredoxin